MAFTETFTAADATAVDTLTNWDIPTGATGCAVNTNAFIGGAGGYGISMNYYNGTFADKHYAKCVFANSGGGDGAVGPAIRMQTGSDACYYACCYGNHIEVGYKAGGGGATPFDETQVASVGDTVELAVDATTATTLLLKINGTTVATYTGKSELTGGKAGIVAFNNVTSARGDTWEGGDISSGATVALTGLGSTTGRGTMVPNLSITL